MRENEMNRRRILRFSSEAEAAAVPPGREDPGLGAPLRENGGRGGGSSTGSSGPRPVTAPVCHTGWT